ncbi:hypothetical protein RHIZO_03214 [Rhizobiaceae bacterium]|nr:hypothetical protein RHIZO_03214 [Rhizobiaceae bacterium]
MTIQTLTTAPTEADLEARIHAALRLAFPWLAPGSLKHETKFAFKFGHREIEIDGRTVSAAQARADILVIHDGKPLAVLELKRAGIALTPEDSEQGLSYARMLHPQPPLVVVTNGDDTVILETHSGQEWKPASPSEAALGELMVAAGKLAAADLREAVATLMGPGSLVWMSAVRAATQQTLSAMTGRWEEFDRPFVDGFLIPREATDEARRALLGSKRITIVEGAPLAGKSSVLREIALSEAASEDMAVLFVEADSYGGGIIAAIAGILADALGWQVTEADTRQWLADMSRQDGPALVLAIDGLGPARDEVRKDIEELSGDRYGDRLKLVLAVDDAVTRRLTMNETGRKATSIGRRAEVVTLDTLSAAEFERAARMLWDHRIGIMQGGFKATEYRVPWILRSLAADVTTAPQYEDENMAASLPPLLGTELLARARARFDDSSNIRHSYRGLAEAVMAETADERRLPATVLQSMETFVIRRKTLKDYIDHSEVKTLIETGYAKESVNADQDAVVIARLPELLASEMAVLLAHELKERMDKADEAAAWFVARCARLPLGDIIGAQALFDLVGIGGSIPWQFIAAMLRMPPRTDSIRPGMAFAMSLPGGGRLDFRVGDDGKVMVQGGGVLEVLDADDFADGDLYADMDSWMILAHLAGHPFVAQSADGTLAGRADPALLTEIGTAPMALRRPAAQEDINGVLMHHIDGHGSIVCHEEGIVEPVTLSIYHFLLRDHERVEDWLDEAIARRSLPLLARIDIALRMLTHSGNRQVAAWAKRMLENSVGPALRALPALHG